MAKKLTQEQFIESAKSVHGDKYDYSKVVYCGSKEKIEIICPVHGAFFQKPNKHISQRQGCPLCAKNHRLTKTDWIQKAVLVHGDKYDYSLVDYKGADKKVEIVCKKCGEHFEQLAGNHLKGKGCPVCRYDSLKNKNPMKTIDGKQHLKETILNKYGVDNVAKSQHYRDIYSLTKEKRISSLHKNGTFVVSKSEINAYRILCNIFGDSDIERQYSSNEYPFLCDFYVTSRNMYIELNISWTHGHHWYGSDVNDDIVYDKWLQKSFTSNYYKNALVTWTKRDVNKRNIAMKHELNYVVFWDRNMYDFDEWIKSGCPDGKDWDRMYSWKGI